MLLAGCGEICGNEVIKTVVSPSGTLKAIIFSRNCGATTGFNTQVSVLPANESLTKDAGNIFIINGSAPINLKWESDLVLRISGIGSAHPVKQGKLISGVEVIYAD
jgi:hypothetical protein